MKKPNAAVIGVGSMGKNHARIYSQMDSVNLVAVSDVNGKLAKDVAGDYYCKAYTNYKQMLKKEHIDFVSVVVPTMYHKDVAIECMKSGKHVLLEKPISDTSKNAREIIKVAKKENVKFTIGHIERFNPAVIELKKRLENNELGKVFSITANRVGPFPTRVRDVGVVIDLAVHDIDIMRYLTNSEVKRIYAEAERRIHTSHEDLLNGLLKFKNGALGVLSVDWLTPEKIREISIKGERGMFVVKYLTQELLFYENRMMSKNGYSYSDMLMGVTEGDITNIRINKKEPLKSELESFVDCVVNNKQPIVSAEDGLKALEIAEKIIESSVSNRVISL